MTFDPPPETVGERVRRQRKRLGLEVRELAERAGVAPATIVRIEGGSGVRGQTLDRLAEALEAPVSWLRDGVA